VPAVLLEPRNGTQPTASPALAVMIARDRRAARFCRPVGDRHLAVPVEHEADFRKAVRTLGYVLPPGR
jgi:hypothetical protein